jgi:integrase/recombinase XerC
MKLFISAAKLYAAESGRVRTEQSRISFLKVMRLLQSQFPAHHIRHFTEENLAEFCLSRNPAPNTIRQRRAYVRSSFEWFAWKNLISDNPAANLKMAAPTSGGNVRLGTWLDEGQVAEIYRQMGEGTPLDRRNRLIFLFGIMTGLRLFELAGIRWSSFDDNYRTVTILGKGNQPAQIMLPGQLRVALAEWRKEAWLGASAVFPSVKEFMNMRAACPQREQALVWDKPLGEAGLRYAIRGAGRKLGVRLNPHDLRRSYAGILEAQGSDLKDIQLALRHDHLATTDTYLRKNPARAGKVTGEFGLEL